MKKNVEKPGDVEDGSFDIRLARASSSRKWQSANLPGAQYFRDKWESKEFLLIAERILRDIFLTD